ncbi:MAG: ferritin [Fibrobacteres bacterium]|nr:ferritin [Fibrobacterota bacterium]
MSSQIIESGLSTTVHDIHRALASLQEELEAIDYYNQRAESSHDQSLKDILIHNRDEEIEHAAMLLEWLRNAMPVFDGTLGAILFKDGSVTENVKQIEDKAGKPS